MRADQSHSSRRSLVGHSGPAGLTLLRDGRGSSRTASRFRVGRSPRVQRGDARLSRVRNHPG
eukprot:5678105-Alexandrium_andersonii.AAC.1